MIVFPCLICALRCDHCGAPVYRYEEDGFLGWKCWACSRVAWDQPPPAWVTGEEITQHRIEGARAGRGLTKEQKADHARTLRAHRRGTYGRKERVRTSRL